MIYVHLYVSGSRSNLDMTEINFHEHFPIYLFENLRYSLVNDRVIVAVDLVRGQVRQFLVSSVVLHVHFVSCNHGNMNL